jgi:hypothetical protein
MKYSTSRVEQYNQVVNIIKITYIWILICFIQDIYHWTRLSQIIENYDFTISFLNQRNHEWNITIIFSLYFLNLIFVAFFSDIKPTRISLALLGILYLGLFRSINPAWNAKDTGILISCWFALLPSNWSKNDCRKNRELVIESFVGAQVILILPYLISGIQKLFGSILHSGTNSFFLMMQISPLNSFYLPDDGILNPYLVNYAPLLFIGLWILAISMVTSPIIIMRPFLQPIWGIIFSLFHILSGFTLQIFYFPQLFLILLYFLQNPFIANSFQRFTIDIRNISTKKINQIK